MIYRSRGEQANHYTINAIQDKKTKNSPQNTTQKTDGEAVCAPLKTGWELSCSGKVSSSYSSNSTRRVTGVKHR